MCISHPLDARVAALRAAVGCGWTYRRGAAWAWEDMPICAFRRSLHTTLHAMHTILHTIFGHSVQLKS